LYNYIKELLRSDPISLLPQKVLTILGKIIKIVKKMREVNMEATATEIKNKFGKFSDIARNEPVIVKMLIGVKRQQELRQMDMLDRNNQWLS